MLLSSPPRLGLAPAVPSHQEAVVLRKKIGQRVRDLRKARKVSQQALAEKAGMSWQYLGNVERAEASPTLDVIEKLIKALGCSPGELLAADEIVETREVQELLADVPEKAKTHILSAMRHVILAVREAARETGNKRGSRG